MEYATNLVTLVSPVPREDDAPMIATNLVTLVPLVPREDDAPMILRVQSQNRADICYRIGRSTPIRSLMLDYCIRMGIVYGTARFTFDGSNIGSFDTAKKLGMEDDNVIDVWVDQLGG